MATKNQRKVRRGYGRQQLASGFGARRWYDLPDWLRIWLADVAGWFALVLALVLAPATLLAIVLGVHALPLEFLGIPGTNNNVGLAAAAVVLQFVLSALAVRPLWAKRRRGWQLLIAVMVVNFGHSLLLQHAVTAGFELVLTIYLYWQVRPRYR